MPRLTKEQKARAIRVHSKDIRRAKNAHKAYWPMNHLRMDIKTNAAAEAIEEYGLKHKRSDIVAGAASQLGWLGKKRSVPALIEALDHKDVDVVKNAISALGAIKDPRAIDVIIEKGLKGPTALRENSAKALGKIGDKRALPHLMKLSGHENKTTNREIKKAIAKIQAANRKK